MAYIRRGGCGTRLRTKLAGKPFVVIVEKCDPISRAVADPYIPCSCGPAVLGQFENDYPWITDAFQGSDGCRVGSVNDDNDFVRRKGLVERTSDRPDHTFRSIPRRH